eukprot:gene14099-14219_t
MVDFIGRMLLMGCGATAAMDIWAVCLYLLFGQALPNWGLVGRWFAHIPRGTLFHTDINTAQPVPSEMAIGWVAHYIVGIAYAGLLIGIAGPAWTAHPTFLPAWIVGLVTVGAGWFLLQPGMGAGWAASLRPNPMRIRALNIVAHSVFALGLYGTALLIA